MDAGIILGGQTVDVLGAMDRGRASAENQITLNRQNALAQLYKSQGAGILAGDQGALNALAGVDPSAAMAAQGNLLGMESTRLGMDQTRQQMAVLDENNKRAAEEYARGLSKEQAAAEAAKIEAGVKQALMAPTPEAFDALMVQIGQPDMVGQFENRDMLAGQFMSVAEILKMTNPEGPEWRAATPEEATAYGAPSGQINNKTGEFKKIGEGKGISYTTKNADGSETTVQFGGEAVTGQPTSGDALRASMTDAESVVSLIDEIAKDPALAGVTGSWEGGGGNNVDEFSGTRRAYYGDAGLSVIQKIAQLQGNAWLGARALLKGGGAITDYESRKAEAAMARLSRAQGDKEFQAALNDLKVAIQDGMAKLQGADSGSQPGFDQAEIDALMNGP